MSTHRWAALAAMLLASCGASAPSASDPAPITETATSDEDDDDTSRDTEPSAAPTAIDRHS